MSHEHDANFCPWPFKGGSPVAQSEVGVECPSVAVVPENVETLIDLTDWLDASLASLEERFSEFVTEKSSRLGRSTRR